MQSLSPPLSQITKKKQLSHLAISDKAAAATTTTNNNNNNNNGYQVRGKHIFKKKERMKEKS